MSRTAIRRVEVLLLLLLVAALGGLHFSQVDSEEQRQIELQAGLEQLYALEQAHYARFGRYFDPGDSTAGLEWEWLGAYEWKIKIQESEFWIAARADRDGDGQQGVWFLDEANQLQVLIED